MNVSTHYRLGPIVFLYILRIMQMCIGTLGNLMANLTWIELYVEFAASVIRSYWYGVEIIYP